MFMLLHFIDIARCCVEGSRRDLARTYPKYSDEPRGMSVPLSAVVVVIGK